MGTPSHRARGELRVMWLKQNPLGEPTDESAGELVQVSDGETSVYLLPHEYRAADEEQLRGMLEVRRATGQQP